MNRIHFEWTNPNDFDNELEVVSGDHGLTISVTDEKAMDSYNSNFTCEIVLPREVAIALNNAISEALKET
jgi:hypothetical protein